MFMWLNVMCLYNICKILCNILIIRLIMYYGKIWVIVRVCFVCSGIFDRVYC